MPGIEALLAITTAFFLVTVAPGPANIAVSTVSMAAGRRSGLIFGLGLSLGLAFWGAIAATGLGALLQSAAHALMVLKILGGLYLLWLAFQSARSAAQPVPPVKAMSGSGKWFVRGLVLNLSNPKAVLAWMAALSVGLSPDAGILALMVATAICMMLGVANYVCYALLFSMRGMMNAYAQFRRWVDGVVAVLFAAAGFGLIRSAFSK